MLDYWLLINYGLVSDLANVNYVGDTTESVNTLSEKYKKVLNLFPLVSYEEILFVILLSGCNVGDYVRPLLPGNVYLQDGQGLFKTRRWEYYFKLYFI